MKPKLWNLFCFLITPVVVLMLFMRDPRAFISDYRDFIRDNKK